MRSAIAWSLGALAAAVVVLGAACGTNRLTDSGGNTTGRLDASYGCRPGQAGCSCDQPGATAACGSILQQNGGYVSCSQGTSTCSNGAWGPCVGNTVVTKSLSGATLDGKGAVRALYGVGQCPNDPCDPACQDMDGGPADIDAQGVIITEAGVTIPPTITYEGGGGDGGACQGLQCQVDWTCPSNSSTTLKGTVYDPAGNNPLYDAYVYIPIDPNPANLPPFTQGVTCDTCAGAGTLNVVAAAQTDPTGSFTLTNVPTTAKAPGNPIPLVIQMGKWRRVTTLASVPDCQTTQVPPANSRLPRNQTDGYGGHADMPQVAFVSGSADPFECMLLKAGIDPNEFGSSSLNSNRRFHYYNSPDKPGNSIDPAFGNVVTGDKLWNNSNAPWNLSAYDVVILACEGAEENKSDRSTNGYGNLVNYTAAGGRVFLSHYSYVWMKYNSPWQNVVAQWGGTTSVDTQDALNATIYTTNFPKGQAFQTWLGDQPNPNALTGGTLPIHQARQDFAGALASGVQPWMTAVDTAVGAFGGGTGSCSQATCSSGSNCNTGACVGAVGGTCSATPCARNSDCGAGGTCNGGKAGTCYNGNSCYQNSDCGSGHTCHNITYGTCAGTGGAQCFQNSDCPGSGQTCSGVTNGTCTCANSNDCPGNSNVCVASATYNPSFTYNTPLGASAANQCGRVDFSDFHVATSAQVTSTSCNTNADCGYGAICGGANGVVGQCTLGACDPDQGVASQCGDSHFSCAGATAGTCGCYSNNDCSSMSAGTCHGGSLGQCSTATCSQNTDCARGVCNLPASGKCECYQNSDCASGTCVGGSLGKCSSGASCESDADCGAGHHCSHPSPVAGVCSAGSCTSSATCTKGPQACSMLGTCGCVSGSDCSSGTCTGTATAGACTSATCYANGDCTSGTGTCNGSPADGTCAANSCTSNSQCSALSWHVGFHTINGQEQCTTSGNCNGCFTEWDCPGSTSVCVGGAPPGQCSGTSSNFPYECAQGLLDPQEAALEFEFFDLSACLSANNQPPPGPPTPVTTYNPVTFTVDFQSVCPKGYIVKWRELDWQATIPATASIVFDGQTAAPAADGGIPSYAGVQMVLLATATSANPVGSALIDTGSLLDAGAGSGAFDLASPPVTSQADFRLSVTLNPTTDKSAAPTLIAWQVKSDCIASE